jgi:protein tyrosine/serine phosphatase
MLGKIKIYLGTCGILVILAATICTLFALYGNVFRKPYPSWGKELCWILGKPESAYNFGVVEEGRLFRSGLPDDRFIHFLKKNYKINQMISLCGECLPNDETAKELGIELHTFGWSPSAAPDSKDIGRVFSLMRDTNHIVLVFCGAGSDRTGYAVARYRILQQNWPLGKALTEMGKFWHKRNVLDELLEKEFSQK